ncbi:MAG: hypothetical protein KIS67_27335 [Verrucomicrobiae bacterium]|nr:hypothetical protein [Verrucomicrobiae bacterium]
MKRFHRFLTVCLQLCWLGPITAKDDLAQSFREPPDAARPGAYWYFMDGNLSREGMTRDLESMKVAGMGHVVFLEVNVGVPRGRVDFLSEEWQELFVHAVREAERLGIEIILGSGPGWAGSGGPWVKPEQSMQHLVASPVEVQGPGPFTHTLPVAPPRRPFFGDVPRSMRAQWESFHRDVAVLAFPTPATPATLPDIDEKALVYRAPFSSQPNVKARLEAPAEFPADPRGSTIPLDRVIDLTQRLKSDGTLDWQVPEGKWTVLRFVSRNSGASTRPAPNPGIGFECDKFDVAALEAHFAEYAGKLLEKVGPRKKGRGWTMLHIDSWEMGAQNWTPRLREEFRKRRGYDPQPFYPAYLGYVVGSREQSERFLWDLRLTGQELVIQNHAEHLKRIGRKHGFTLSIEPYDMNPTCDFDLGAVADVPMCEFWSLGFDTTYSCHTASSIAHVLGRPVVAAEAFTADHREAWRFHPGYLKNQGDWAFATGINRFTYHTFAHKPDEGRPGMVMGPYGVHWDRSQTWWPMVAAYHRYITRCQHLLQQGRTIADVLYLLPEGAPNVFQPPPSAFAGSTQMPDRRGYNFDGCSAETLLKLARVRGGKIVFPSGAEYSLLVLPNVETMTPELIRKLDSLVKAGAPVVGNPPRKSPSLVNYPACDGEVARRAEAVWGGLQPPADLASRRHGKGRIIWGMPVYDRLTSEPSLIMQAQWIWFPQGEPARSAPVGAVSFRREIYVPASKRIASARLEMTADNRFSATLNGTPVLEGDNFNVNFAADVTKTMQRGTNVLTVVAENGGDEPNPAGLIGALRVRFTDRSEQIITTDGQWMSSDSTNLASGKFARVLGEAAMSPWQLKPSSLAPPLYPHYDLTATVLREMGVSEDFASPGPLRYTHRRTKERDIYFVANRSGEAVRTTATFRVATGAPELWHPNNGEIQPLPQFTRTGGVTEIPLRFNPYESCFVIFPSKKAAAVGSASNRAGQNFAEFTEIQNLQGQWDVSFDPTLGAPAQVRFEKLEDWTQRPESGIKYYSGIATYRTRFDLPDGKAVGPESRIHLDLGGVQVMARVRVNGTDCGVTWTAPWRVDISRAVKPKGNELEIEVANLWPNRMIGDAASPGQPFSQTTYRPYKAGDPLLPSGLLGPVRLMQAENLEER